MAIDNLNGIDPFLQQYKNLYIKEQIMKCQTEIEQLSMMKHVIPLYPTLFEIENNS